MTSPRLRMTTAVVGTLLAVAAAAPADALVLCKARKGGLTVRDQCKKKELQLDASTVGAKGDPGLPGAPGPGFVVVDKDGKEVGTLLSGSTAFTSVLREINGAFFVLQVTGSGYFHQFETDSFVAYTAPTCTGPAFLSGSPLPDVPLTPTVMASIDEVTGYFVRNSESKPAPSMMVYAVRPETGPDGPTAHQACLDHGGVVVKDVYDCRYPFPNLPKCVWCCEGGSISSFAAPAHTVDLGALGLTPPFAVKAK